MKKIVEDGLTFDDILIIPEENNLLPESIDIKTMLTKGLDLNVPIISAAMDTVTESKMAISMARQGGIGIIHKNMSIEAQCTEVDKVKRSEKGVITDPFFLTPNNYVFEADDLMAKYQISGVPITENDKLVGIITNRDLRFENDHHKKIYEVMTKDNLVTAPVGTTVSEAKKILTKYKIEKLPIVDEKYNLKGLITIKDIQKGIKYPNSTTDINGRLKVAAAIGFNGDFIERTNQLIEAKVDVVVMETINGYNIELINAVKEIKNLFPNLQVIAGNVTTQGGAMALIDAGADGILVGMGAGSTSTTSVVSGVGTPQITAIMNCAEVTQKYKHITLISNGGIKYSGDITKAIAAGADSCIIGKMFAPCQESPSRVEIDKGRKYKIYRGMNSISVINDSKNLFSDEIIDDIIPEGIECRMIYKGEVVKIINQLLGGLRTGMLYCGCKDINELQNKARFLRLTNNSLREAHPDRFEISKEMPNYERKFF